MERAPDVEEFVRSTLEAFEAGDVAGIKKTISSQPGALSIGTDPGEWGEGFDQLVRGMEQEADDTSIKTVLDEVKAYREGTVGWAAGRGRFVLSDGKEVPYRSTLVVHEEEGQWKTVQGHSSIGVPNAEAFGEDQ